MKFGRVQIEGADGPELRIVAARGSGEAIDVRKSQQRRLERAGASAEGARRLAGALVPASMTAALGGGPAFIDALANATNDDSGDCVVAVDDDGMHVPVDPPSFRDFVAFESHFVAGDKAADRPPIDDVLYELPIYYMSNPATLIGPGDVMPWPSYSRHLDYELEVGIVIGRTCSDLRPQDALEHVAGITILNDFTARDIQFREMLGGLGPAKGKHFASAVGPWIVTLDDVDLANITMQARINGERCSFGNLGSIMWGLDEIVAWASAGEVLPAGALLGTGTVGTGSGFEQGRPSLSPGDVVELEIEGIGILRNALATPAEATWTPEPKSRTLV